MARMAAAEALMITRGIDDNVRTLRVVDERMKIVDRKVEGIDDKVPTIGSKVPSVVPSVDHKMQSVDYNVPSVDYNVPSVDHNVSSPIHGELYLHSPAPEYVLSLYSTRHKRDWSSDSASGPSYRPKPFVIF